MSWFLRFQIKSTDLAILIQFVHFGGYLEGISNTYMVILLIALGAFLYSKAIFFSGRSHLLQKSRTFYRVGHQLYQGGYTNPEQVRHYQVRV